MSFPRRTARWSSALIVVALAGLFLAGAHVIAGDSAASSGPAPAPAPAPANAGAVAPADRAVPVWVRAATRARCFGAATRDPRRRCDNPRLLREVIPTPAEAERLPNSPCTLIAADAPLDVCAFGVDARRARGTIAIVGDSHVGHWRAAVDVVARAHRWHALSITHTSCPLSKAVRNLPDPARFEACAQWKDQVFAWFSHHPEVSTVFVAGLSGGAGVQTRPGQSQMDAAVHGYLAAWRALPPTVEHIIVIRDTPKLRRSTFACLDRAMAHREPAGARCAMPRREAMDPDPLVAAAHVLRSPRVQVVDLTRLFCDRRRCYPVVGGALVCRDVTHVTAIFSATLGPYLREAVGRAMRSW